MCQDYSYLDIYEYSEGKVILADNFMMRMIRLLLLLIFTLKSTTEAVSLESRMRALILRPDRKILKIEDEIKQIQFESYEESSFHDSGSGIEITDWDEIVDAIASEYELPDKNVRKLRLAKLMEHRDAQEFKYKLGEAKDGEFKYIQVVVGKDDGLMSYKLVGTQVNFKIKPVVQRKATIDLFFFRLEYDIDNSGSVEAENRLEEYYLYKAQVSAGLHYGFKDDTCYDKHC